MSGLKKKGPARRATKRERQSNVSAAAFAMPNSRKRGKRDSFKTMFLDSV